MMISSTPQAPYPIFVRIFEARESDLVARLSTLYPNESDRSAAQEVLLPQWRSCLVTALGSFMERTRPLASNRPVAETLASLCADVDKAIRENRFLCDVHGRGKPIYDYVVACRKAVGRAIAKELQTERKGGEIRHPTKNRKVSASPTSPSRKRIRPAARSARPPSA